MSHKRFIYYELLCNLKLQTKVKISFFFSKKKIFGFWSIEQILEKGLLSRAWCLDLCPVRVTVVVMCYDVSALRTLSHWTSGQKRPCDTGFTWLSLSSLVLLLHPQLSALIFPASGVMLHYYDQNCLNTILPSILNMLGRKKHSQI